MLEDMTVEQVANFTYWVTEHRTHRNSDKYRGKDRVRFIQKHLRCSKINLLGRFINQLFL